MLKLLMLGVFCAIHVNLASCQTTGAAKDLQTESVSSDESSTVAQEPSKPDAKSSPSKTPKSEEQQANLVKNGSAEDGTDKPDGWQKSELVDGVELKWDRQSGSHGKSSLCLTKTAQRYFPICQWYQVIERPGSTEMLKVKAQVKADGLTKAVLDVQFEDEDGTWIGHQWVSYIGEQDNGPPLTHDWKEYQGQVTIPPTARKLRIGLQIYGPGKVWFDDIQAEGITSEEVVPALSEPISSITPLRVPSIQPARLEIAVKREILNKVVHLTKTEYVGTRQEDLMIQTRFTDDKTAVIVISGSEACLARVSEYIKGLTRLLETPGGIKVKTDETDERFHSDTKELVARVKAAKAPQQSALKKDLEHLITRHFQYRQSRRKREIEDLAQRLDQMRTFYDRRETNQSDIIKNRLREVLEERRDLNWEETQRKLKSDATVHVNTNPNEMNTQTLTPYPPAAISVPKENSGTGIHNDIALGEEPTYEGISYSQWMKTFKTDRSPRKVVEAVNALRTMLNKHDSEDLARGIFRAVRGEKATDSNLDAIYCFTNLETTEKLLLARRCLTVLPPEVVVDMLIDEIQKSPESADLCKLVHEIVQEAFGVKIGPNQIARFQTAKPVILRRAPALLASIVAAPTHFQDLQPTVFVILKECHIKPQDVPGLSMVITELLQKMNVQNQDGGLQWRESIFELAKIDPEFPAVRDAVPQITTTLREYWSELQQLQSVPDEGYFLARGPDGKDKFSGYPRLVIQFTKILSGLKEIGPGAKKSIELLKEISATDLISMHYFQKVPEEIRLDVKKFVTQAIESIEPPTKK